MMAAEVDIGRRDVLERLVIAVVVVVVDKAIDLFFQFPRVYWSSESLGLNPHPFNS
jgi:hypothetical protein